MSREESNRLIRRVRHSIVFTTFGLTAGLTSYLALHDDTTATTTTATTTTATTTTDDSTDPWARAPLGAVGPGSGSAHATSGGS